MNNIPVFLPSDNNYVPYLATCMVSILSNTTSFIDFYILDSGITEENKKKIVEIKKQFHNFSIEFLYIDTNKEFEDMVTSDWINKSGYNRFLIPNLKPSLNKVIYIDSDTIVLQDIALLYNESLDNYAIGAIFNENRREFNFDTKIPMELSSDYRYFNAGVLLIDVQKWIENDIVKKLFDIEKKYRNVIPHADESVLNKCFDKNYKILDLKYNVIDWDFYNNEVKEIVVRHFATKNKPWMLNVEDADKFINNASDFWKYAKQTCFYDDMLTNIKSHEEQEKIHQNIRLYKSLYKMKKQNTEKLQRMLLNIKKDNI